MHYLGTFPFLYIAFCQAKAQSTPQVSVEVLLCIHEITSEIPVIVISVTY